WRVERVHAGFAVSAHYDGPQVAGPDAVFRHQLYGGGAQLVQAVVDFNAVDLGRVDQPLHVFAQPKNRRRPGWRIATDSFKNGGTVVDDMRHYVNLGVFPRDHLSVVPDLLSRLNRHEGGSFRMECAVLPKH